MYLTLILEVHASLVLCSCFSWSLSEGKFRRHSLEQPFLRENHFQQMLWKQSVSYHQQLIILLLILPMEPKGREKEVLHSLRIENRSYVFTNSSKSPRPLALIKRCFWKWGPWKLKKISFPSAFLKRFQIIPLFNLSSVGVVDFTPPSYRLSVLFKLFFSL